MTTDPATERDLGRVEGKLDLVISLLTKSGDNHTSLAERVSKLEMRVALLALAVTGGGTAYAFDLKQLLTAFFAH